MARLLVLVCLIGLAASGPPVTKTKEEIENFRQFLENSRIDDGVLLESRTLAGPDANPWENSGKYGGDILLDDDQIEAMVNDFAGVSNTNGRNGFVVANSRWPNNVMIYQFAAGAYTAQQQSQIMNAISWIEHFSCVRLRRRTNERVVVTMTGREAGCYASVGFSTTWPDRRFNLARNCFTHATIVHELLHSLGFQHMHQTFERDTFVRINNNNIIQGYQFAFDRFPRNQVNLHGTAYEFTSVMHYHDRAFSRNNQPTITALRTFTGQMGRSTQATNADWVRLRRHYNCPGAWSANSEKMMEEEVKRMTPLMMMNMPAPAKGPYTDMDNEYTDALVAAYGNDDTVEDTPTNDV